MGKRDTRWNNPYFNQNTGGIDYGRNWKTNSKGDSDSQGGAGGGAGAGVSSTDFQTLVYAQACAAFAAQERKDTGLDGLKHDIHMGEFIGWRLWRVVSYQDSNKLRLNSVAMSKLWKPGEIVKGDVEAPGMNGYMQGVYSYKTEELCREWTSFGIYSLEDTYVLGEVSIWGEVVDHQFGYRAQFAKMLSLREIEFGRLEDFLSFKTKKSYLERLREIYLGEEE